MNKYDNGDVCKDCIHRYSCNGIDTDNFNTEYDMVSDDEVECDSYVKDNLVNAIQNISFSNYEPVYATLCKLVKACNELENDVALLANPKRAEIEKEVEIEAKARLMAVKEEQDTQAIMSRKEFIEYAKNRTGCKRASIENYWKEHRIIPETGTHCYIERSQIDKFLESHKQECK
jgi:hypothetical protein